MTKRVYNFYAGPATLPLTALKEAQKELLDFKGTGISIMEISHRSKEYDEVHHKASNLVKELMDLPDYYKVLWLQGGASSQFYMVPINLKIDGKSMDYVNTGAWSKKAINDKGAESPEASLTVNMPRNRLLFNQLITRLLVVIQEFLPFIKNLL